MFERFTDRARRVLVLAQEEARLLNHSFIGTEHLLLGLIGEGEGMAANALDALGISLEPARAEVEEIVGIGESVPRDPPPFTPRAKKVLELSLREALQLGHTYIGTEHLLLGVVREGDGVAMQVLASLGVDPSRVRQQVFQLMSGYQAREVVAPTVPPGQRGSVLFGRPRVGETPPWFRCDVCGRSLWETAHFAVGGQGRVCEQCIRAAAAMLEDAVPANRELVLPPRAAGRQPDDPTLQAIIAAVEGALGPEAGPTTWATTIEEPERFVPKLERLFEQRGRAEYLQVEEVTLVNEQLAFVRFDVQVANGRGMVSPGQLRWQEDRWVVTAETLTRVMRGFNLTSEL